MSVAGRRLLHDRVRGCLYGGAIGDAMRPYDGAPEEFNDRGNGTNNRTPSREHSIEELPVALGLLVVSGGDFEQSVFGGASYGRDCDTVASMAGAISGALHGTDAMRPTWIERIKEANRIDLDNLADRLVGLTHRLQQHDLGRAQEREHTFSQLRG